jgi:predicted nucleic acid-binding protein
MIILDSNIWIAYWSKNDTQHMKAEKVFENLNDRIVLPEYLVVEICSVLSLRVSKKMADKFLDFSLNNNETELLLSDEMLFSGSAEVFEKTKTGKLSFVDCSLVYLSNFYEVLTFDKLLQKEIGKKKK